MSNNLPGTSKEKQLIHK